MGCAHASIEQAEVIIYLSYGSYSASRVVADASLVDRHGGTQTFNLIHIWFFQLAEKLSRIGRQRLNIAPLPLGEYCVERQRGLSRSREPCDHHELVSWDLDVDILQVMFASTANDYLIQRTATPSVKR